MTMAAKWMHEDARAQRARRTLPRPKRYVLQASPRAALVADDKLLLSVGGPLLRLERLRQCN